MELDIEGVNIQEKNGELFVSSREIAKNFNKRHSNIIRDIENILQMAQNSQSSNLSTLFLESEYESSGCFYKEYFLTEQGFSVLVMGFTGQKALEWKLKYSNAFMKMRELLRQMTSILTDEQKLQLAIFNAKDKDEVILASAELDRYRKKELQEKVELIEEIQPKADNYDRLLNAEGYITMHEFVKSANLKIGRNKFMEGLRVEGILMKDSTSPYQKFVDQDYFKVKQTVKNGFSVSSTVITKKGLNWLMKKCAEWDLFKEDNNNNTKLLKAKEGGL